MHRRNLAGHADRVLVRREPRSPASSAIERDRRPAGAGQRARRPAAHPAEPRASPRRSCAACALRFEEAGLPTWQIDPRQPRAIDNVLETADGSYQIVDLESGLVSPIASLTTWGAGAAPRAWSPFFDEVFFDVTRAYVAREEAAMRAAMGDAWFAELHATLDAAEAAAPPGTPASRASGTGSLRAVVTGFGVRTWRARVQARTAGGREKAQAWMERAVATWETEERITADEAAALRRADGGADLPGDAALPGRAHPDQHPAALPLRQHRPPADGRSGRWRRRPAGCWRGGSTATPGSWPGASTRRWWCSWPAVPGFGSFAYLAAKPVRANRLLLRTLGRRRLAARRPGTSTSGSGSAAWSPARLGTARRVRSGRSWCRRRPATTRDRSGSSPGRRGRSGAHRPAPNPW